MKTSSNKRIRVEQNSTNTRNHTPTKPRLQSSVIFGPYTWLKIWRFMTIGEVIKSFPCTSSYFNNLINSNLSHKCIKESIKYHFSLFGEKFNEKYNISNALNSIFSNQQHQLAPSSTTSIRSLFDDYNFIQTLRAQPLISISSTSNSETPKYNLSDLFEHNHSLPFVHWTLSVLRQAVIGDILVSFEPEEKDDYIEIPKIKNVQEVKTKLLPYILKKQDYHILKNTWTWSTYHFSIILNFIFKYNKFQRIECRLLNLILCRYDTNIHGVDYREHLLQVDNVEQIPNDIVNESELNYTDVYKSIVLLRHIINNYPKKCYLSYDIYSHINCLSLMQTLIVNTCIPGPLHDLRYDVSDYVRINQIVRLENYKRKLDDLPDGVRDIEIKLQRHCLGIKYLFYKLGSIYTKTKQIYGVKNKNSLSIQHSHFSPLYIEHNTYFYLYIYYRIYGLIPPRVFN